MSIYDGATEARAADAILASVFQEGIDTDKGHHGQTRGGTTEEIQRQKEVRMKKNM